MNHPGLAEDVRGMLEGPAQARLGPGQRAPDSRPCSVRGHGLQPTRATPAPTFAAAPLRRGWACPGRGADWLGAGAGGGGEHPLAERRALSQRARPTWCRRGGRMDDGAAAAVVAPARGARARGGPPGSRPSRGDLAGGSRRPRPPPRRGRAVPSLPRPRRQLHQGAGRGGHRNDGGRGEGAHGA